MSSMMLSAVFLTAAKTQTVAADSVESANSEKVTDNTVQASNKGAEAKQAAINTAQASNREVKVKQDIKAGQVPDEAVNPLLRSMAHTASTGYFPKEKEKWRVIDTTTGSNGYLMQSNKGHYRYVVTRSPTQTVLHVMKQGWGDAMSKGFGFGHN